VASSRGSQSVLPLAITNH